MRIGRIGTATDTGRRRLKNEDSLVNLVPLFAIADGMGGARAGEVASRIAATALEETAAEMVDGPSLQRAVQLANSRVLDRALADPETIGMGTTMTAALVDEKRGRVIIGHVGDSRAYRVRQGALEQLTADHSLVGELLREGRLTPAEAEKHPHRAVITRVVGTEPEVEVDTSELVMAPGDLYLLCSDGLTDMVRDEEILTIVSGFDGDPAQVAHALVRAANSAGGDDNISVVAFEITDEEPVVREPDARPQGSAGAIQPGRPARRFGAAAGSRWPALFGLLGGLGIAALIVLWSLVR